MATPLIMTASGIRGIVGDNLDPALAVTVAKAFAYYLSSINETGPIIVGGDTRTSHDLYKNAVTSGLNASGYDAIDIGMCPTPTGQQMIRHHNASGAIIVTASHNPAEYNGLKIMNASGSFLNPQEFEAFKAVYDAKEESLVPWDRIGKVIVDDQAIHKHVDKILAELDTSALRKKPLRILVDVNHGAGAVANPILFKKLGIDADIMYPEPNGQFFHTPEPTKENLSALMKKMKSGNYDIGFAQDPDADRLVIIDENGHFIGEDYSLALCVEYILKRHSNDTDKNVVVNLSTSLVIEAVAANYQASTHYTKIGETNVTQGIRERNATVGGEGNGGIIYPKIGWGRDSLAGIVMALNYLAESGKTVSEIVKEYPKFTMIKDKKTVSSRDDVLPLLDKIESYFSNSPLDKQDGIKVSLTDSWIQVRPSNTEPIVRIFVEAPTPEEAEKLMSTVQSL